MDIVQRINNLLYEARVKTSGADIFLNDFVPMFLWSPKSGPYWAVNPQECRDGWQIYQGSKRIGKDIEGKYFTDTAFVHDELIDYWVGATGDDFHKYIRGRISPDGRTIFIHDRFTTDYDQRTYEKMVDKTVDAVYKHMKNYIK